MDFCRGQHTHRGPVPGRKLKQPDTSLRLDRREQLPAVGGPLRRSLTIVDRSADLAPAAGPDVNSPDVCVL